MAYVGGGFGRAGLHSVLEPAAWSVPVAFGPGWRNSRDAELLLGAGGAPLSRQAPEGRGSAGKAVEQLDLDEAGRRDQGSRRGVRGGEWWRRSGEQRGDAGPAYFVTTPSNVTERGTIRPAVSAVISTSLQRLRALILSPAMPLPPASWAASAFRSDGDLRGPAPTARRPSAGSP